MLFPSAEAEPLRDVVAARQAGGGAEARGGAEAGGQAEARDRAEAEGAAEADGAVGRPVDLIVPDGSWLEATRINLQLPAAPRVRLAETTEVEAAEAAAAAEEMAAAAAPALEPAAAEGDPLTTHAAGARELSGECSRVSTTSVDAADAPHSLRADRQTDRQRNARPKPRTTIAEEQQQSLSAYAADALSLRGESSLGAVARALGELREAVTT